jgi:hypothetical protein
MSQVRTKPKKAIISTTGDARGVDIGRGGEILARARGRGCSVG